MKYEDEQILIERVSASDDATSNGALWMLLLLRLTAVATDDRLELRNSGSYFPYNTILFILTCFTKGAIQTLLRIFDANGDMLSPEAWLMCVQSVIFKMLSSIETQMSILNESESSHSLSEKAAWIETTVVILNGVSGLLATYLHVLTSHSSFTRCWQTLLKHFKTLLNFGDLDVNTAVFKALRQILSSAKADPQLETEAQLSRGSVNLVWELWSEELPLTAPEASEVKQNNQDCLIAYVSALKEVYRLMEQHIDITKSQRVLVLLREAVQQASATAYSADVEYLTTLQTQVLESLSTVRTNISGVPAVMVKQVSEFVGLAYQQVPHEKSIPQRPTYVALSKASMTLLESLILAHASDPEIYEKGAFALALIALAKPITAKYAFALKTKSLPPWKQATTTALTILNTCLPVINTTNIPENDLRSIWTAIVQISNGITAADCTMVSEPSSIANDQEFDINSFLALRELITPALGNPAIPDKTRRIYTESLFQTSLIHAPEPWELPKMNQELLASLCQPRRGRTVDSPPSPRAKMSYVCLDELVALVSMTDSSPARVKLAQAAAPYFILRAGLTLRAYNADQPLRGHMPQPLTQRKELLYILKALVRLRCEPEAIPETPGVESEGKKHLHRLYPLLAKGVRAAARDQEVLEWVGKSLDEVGMEFGV